MGKGKGKKRRTGRTNYDRMGVLDKLKCKVVTILGSCPLSVSPSNTCTPTQLVLPGRAVDMQFNFHFEMH